MKTNSNEKVASFNPSINIPVNLFGSVMSVAGLSLAWKLAAGFWNLSDKIGDRIGIIAWVIFILLSIGYLTKWICFPSKVKDEFYHPIVGNFFGTIPIALLLLSAVAKSHFPVLGYVTWIVGTVLMLLLAYIFVYRLLEVRQEHLNVTPAWLIAGVGTLDIAVSGGGFSAHWAKEINLLSFSIGIILALVFYTIIISRLLYHDKLAQKMEPSLIILVAPFAVGFLGYFSITGEIDFFASILFYFGVFIFAIVFVKVFFQKTSFILTWWAAGFPIAALSNAALKYAMHNHSFLPLVIAISMLVIVTFLITYMLIKSLYLLFTKRLFLS